MYNVARLAPRLRSSEDKGGRYMFSNQILVFLNQENIIFEIYLKFYGFKKYPSKPSFNFYFFFQLMNLIFVLYSYR